MYTGTYNSKGEYIPPCTPPHCKNIQKREVKQMSEQDRFKEIAKVASAATATIVDITKKLADNNIVSNDLAELAYQLGYIEGLSHVLEEGE